MDINIALKALGVAVLSLVITLAASFPMVAFYAYVIDPGHPPEFYNEAAQWIAPWSSHILGPVCFFALNYWISRQSSPRAAFNFAVATLVAYLVIEVIFVAALDQLLVGLLSLTMGLSFAAKAAGAILGAKFASRNNVARVQEA